MPVSPCVCCCCTCARARAFLASAYTIDLSGTWDVSGCNPATGGCGVSETSALLPEVGEDVCAYSTGLIGGGEFCLSGYQVREIGLVLSDLDGTGCEVWNINIVFHDLGGGPGVQFIYRQRSHNCKDPTGIYDLDSYDNCGGVPSVPATVEIT